MKSFYSRLSYSIGNEDWKTEQEALKIQPTDRILCVTASGDRPLNLLLSDCKEVVTVDANPTQNALFDLKRAALSTLPYERYLSFLGATKGKSKERLHTFNHLEKELTAHSGACWKKNRNKIAAGILYEGALEKWAQRISFLIRNLRRKKVERLFSFEDLEEQKGFVEREWNCPSWKKAFEIALHPFFPRVFLKDPGLYAHVDPSLKVSEHIYDRLTFALKQFPAKESLLISLVINGKISREGFPPYLDEEGVNTIKKRIERLSFQTVDVITYLESAPERSFDCFSLSDVASYIDKETFNRMVRAIFRAAKPGARFCIRQFMSRHDFSEEFIPHFQRDLLLEERLTQEDRCFIYQFMVGKIVKA